MVVYPLDVMIPLLDLHQESRCDVSIKNLGLRRAKGRIRPAGWLVTWSIVAGPE